MTHTTKEESMTLEQTIIEDIDFFLKQSEQAEYFDTELALELLQQIRELCVQQTEDATRG